MSNAITGLLFGVGFGSWVYFMLMRRSGGNAKNSLIVASIAALIGFFMIFSLLGIVFKTQ